VNPTPPRPVRQPPAALPSPRPAAWDVTTPAATAAPPAGDGARLSPVPASMHTRPRDTIAEYEASRERLVATGQTPRPELIATDVAITRLGRLEDQAAEQAQVQWQQGQAIQAIRDEMRTNTRATVRTFDVGKITALMATIAAGVALASQVLGQFGADHPEAKVGFVGVLLGLAEAYNRVRAGKAPPGGPAGALATAQPPPSAPPGHS
jgi:hypothetical protein